MDQSCLKFALFLTTSPLFGRWVAPFDLYLGHSFDPHRGLNFCPGVPDLDGNIIRDGLICFFIFVFIRLRQTHRSFSKIKLKPILVKKKMFSENKFGKSILQERQSASQPKVSPADHHTFSSAITHGIILHTDCEAKIFCIANVFHQLVFTIAPSGASHAEHRATSGCLI